MGVDHIPDAQEMEKLGEPRGFDQEFSGPIVERECRDIFFLLLFILFWIGMFVVAILAFRKGDPRRYAFCALYSLLSQAQRLPTRRLIYLSCACSLLYGTDADGNICNAKNNELRNGIDMVSVGGCCGPRGRGVQPNCVPLRAC